MEYFSPNSVLMVRLPGWLHAWLPSVRILPLSLVRIKLLSAYLIGERLWNRSIMLFFVTRHGPLFLHHLELMSSIPNGFSK